MKLKAPLDHSATDQEKMVKEYLDAILKGSE